jgi:hypothetical protein
LATARNNPSPVRRRLMKAPEHDTLSPRERAVLSRPRGAIRLPRRWFLAKLTNLVWRSRFVAAVMASTGCGKTLVTVILRSPDRIGTTKDLRSGLREQLRGFFASLRMTGCKCLAAASFKAAGTKSNSIIQRS